MRIICSDHDCIYHSMGECNLKRAASPGTGESKGCAYYIRKIDRQG